MVIKLLETRTEMRALETVRPHIQRVVVPPPGVVNPDMIQRYGLYTNNEINPAIENSDLSLGGKSLLQGILIRGGIALFPGSPNSELGFDVGIDYDYVFKHSFDSRHAQPAVEELAIEMKNVADSRSNHGDKVIIGGILAPEHSAIKIATLVGNYLTSISPQNVYVHSVRKNGGNIGEFTVDVDAYSRAQTDTLWLNRKTLELIEQTGTSLVLIDDIIDTGAMTNTVALILQLARENGFHAKLIGVGAPIEKVWTNARDNIAREIGAIPVRSILVIEDMGTHIDSKPRPWLKVAGVEKAIPCRLKDLR